MAPNHELQGVLFDMDGTICDTEPCWIEAEHRMAAAHGVRWTEADAIDLVGNDLYETGRVVREKMRAQRLTPEEVVHELIDYLEVVVGERGLAWLPGALELVDECNAAGMPVAVVTMSWLRNARPVLDAMPTGRFDAVVTGDSVRNGKPHPEPYLRGAELLGASADSCVAIEDSATGAASAQAAGCTVVAVPNHVAVDPAPRRYILADGLSGVRLVDLRRMHTRQERSSDAAEW